MSYTDKLTADLNSNSSENDSNYMMMVGGESMLTEIAPSKKGNDIEPNPPQRETDVFTLEELEAKRSNNWANRNLTALSTGGVRSSVLTLFAGTVGAGILSLPYVILFLTFP